MVNLQAGLDHPEGYAGLWVNNLLDERDPSVGIPWTDASQGFRREWLVVPEDGLTAGLRIKVKF
jgi:outer membrane receptor protein involved in Fe transport